MDSNPSKLVVVEIFSTAAAAFARRQFVGYYIIVPPSAVYTVAISAACIKEASAWACLSYPECCMDSLVVVVVAFRWL